MGILEVTERMTEADGGPSILSQCHKEGPCLQSLEAVEVAWLTF